MQGRKYLHGYSNDEQDRLRRQARFAEFHVHRDVDLTGVKRLIEIGCGVGAQSEILLRRYPRLELTGIDRSKVQLDAAERFLATLDFARDRYELHEMDATAIHLSAESFDGAFLCWILEHVDDPAAVLSEARRLLAPGGRLYVTEVMNSSFFLDPYSPATWKYWMTFNDFQYENGGDPFVGAKLGNLLLSTGFREIETHVKTWHLDNRQPARRQEMIAYWCELMLSAAPQLQSAGLVSDEELAAVKDELNLVSRNPHAVFLYSFCQATAKV